MPIKFLIKDYEPKPVFLNICMSYLGKKTIYKIETKREKKKSELYNMERTQAVDSKFETEKEYNFGTYNPKN